MEFRNDIQGLRALAFLSVFIFHLNSKWLPGGFLGVDLFFVISGYLITTITISDIEKRKFSFFVFFKKRIKRIIPAYYALLLICILIGNYIYLYTDLDTFIKSLKYATLFISNYVFSTGNSYFGSKLSENPFLHTWSLSIEMQFYILLPIIIFYFRRYLKFIFIFLIIVLTIYSTYFIDFKGDKSSMYFSLLARIPEFLVGCLYSIVFNKGLDLGKTKNNILAIISLSIFLACTVLINEESDFPGYLALLPTLSIANLLVLHKSFISKFISNKILVKIGEYSYSLYLWHWPIMAFLRYRNDTYEFTWQQVFLVIFLTSLLSWFSYNLVENRSRLLSDNKFLIIYGFIFITILSLSFSIKKLSSNKIISKIYSKPHFGLNSHGTQIIETFGAKSKNDSIVLIGDSHALMLKPFLDTLGKKNNFSYKTLTCNAFIAIDGIDTKEIVDQIQLDFYYNSKKNISHTRDLIQNNNIIIINSHNFSKYSSIESSLDSLINTLRADQKLILVNTFPVININPIKINNGFLKRSTIEIFKMYKTNSLAVINRLKSKHNNVYIFDLSKSKIFNTPGYINDTVAYYNYNHINTFASLKLAEDLEEDFMNFFNEVRSK